MATSKEDAAQRAQAIRQQLMALGASAMMGLTYYECLYDIAEAYGVLFGVDTHYNVLQYYWLITA